MVIALRHIDWALYPELVARVEKPRWRKMEMITVLQSVDDALKKKINSKSLRFCVTLR